MRPFAFEEFCEGSNRLWAGKSVATVPMKLLCSSGEGKEGEGARVVCLLVQRPCNCIPSQLLRRCVILPAQSAVSVTWSSGLQPTGWMIFTGELKLEKNVQNLSQLPEASLKIMLSISNPETVFSFDQLLSEGIGFTRFESVINNALGVHPKALLNCDTLDGEHKALS